MKRLVKPAVARAVAVSSILAVALVANAPLRLLSAHAADAGLGHREATGTLWTGQFVGATFQGMPVGDLDVALSPASLLAGRPVLLIRATGDTPLQARCNLVETGPPNCHISVTGGS